MQTRPRVSDTFATASCVAHFSYEVTERYTRMRRLLNSTDSRRDRDWLLAPGTANAADVFTGPLPDYLRTSAATYLTGRREHQLSTLGRGSFS